MAIVLLPLTDMQEKVLAFMWSFYQENDQLPSGGVIQRHFGWGSKNSVVCHLQYLEDKGYVERNSVCAYRFTALFHAEQRQKQSAEEGEN